MKSSATTVAQYLASLPAERREPIAALRALVNEHLPRGYRETMSYGMIVWCVPLEVYPDTYNGQALAYAGLASQKQNMAIYLMTVYGAPAVERRFRDAFAKAGKKLDMGKSCVRFRKLEDLHLPAIADAIAACSLEDYVAIAKAAHGSPGRAARKAEREKLAGRAAKATKRTPAAAKARPARKAAAKTGPAARKPGAKKPRAR